MKNNIKNLMEKSNINVGELSKETGIGRTTISTLINKDELPDSTKIGTLQKISACLNTDINSLFKETYNIKFLDAFDNEGNKVFIKKV